MVTVTADDGNPVRVVLLIPGMNVPFTLFGRSIKGKFVHSDSSIFVVARKLPNSDLVMRLSEWTLDVECKMRDSDNILKYTCKQFPGPVVASEAQFELLRGKIILRLPKADPSQSWAGALSTKGLDQST